MNTEDLNRASAAELDARDEGIGPERARYIVEDRQAKGPFLSLDDVEAAGALVIFAGAGVGFVRFVWAAIRTRRAEKFVPVRLDLGRFLALGLEFQLGSDLLRTAVAPTTRGGGWPGTEHARDHEHEGITSRPTLDARALARSRAAHLPPGAGAR
jgi:hypothetical protein